MENIPEIREKAEEIGLSGPVFTLGTANSACSMIFYARISGIQANPLKYTDPDGNTPKTTLEMQIESAVKVMVFLYQNKDSIKKIGEGATKIAIGFGLATLGVSGGIGITISSGGTAALGGIALADAAIFAGGACASTGVADVLDGIVMLSQGNRSIGRGNNENQPASKEETDRFVRKIEKELGKDARRAFHDMKLSGAPDRSLAELKVDAEAVYREYGKLDIMPNWREP